jgi:CRP-like cAMP-binding protein
MDVVGRMKNQQAELLRARSERASASLHAARTWFAHRQRDHPYSAAARGIFDHCRRKAAYCCAEVQCGHTHEVIAQMIGTSRETGTRLLHQRRHQKVASIKGEILTINNHSALSALAV